MAAQKSMLNEFPWDEDYRVSNIENVLTPALVVYPEVISSNIEQTLRLLGGDANRWRVHIKRPSWTTPCGCSSNAVFAISSAPPRWNCS